MRKTAHAVIKENLRSKIFQTRVKNKWTKRRMAEMLAMDDRSYSDIENGISSCSVVTLVIFIAFVLEDSVQKEELFKELRESIEKAWLETYNTK